MDFITLNQTGFEAAIIDLDGTMVDTLGDFVQALNLMLGELNLPNHPQVDRLLVERMVGKGSENLIKSVLNHLGAECLRTQTDPELIALRSVQTFDAAFSSYQKHYLAINGQYSQVYPGVLAGLRNMRRASLRLACLTNKPLAFAEALLRLKGLDGFFSHVFGGDSFERKKPDPMPLLKTCGALGSLPARTLMVGDSSNDARAARAAGCPVLLVSYGYNHGQPVREVDADGFIDSLAEVIGQT